MILIDLPIWYMCVNKTIRYCIIECFHALPPVHVFPCVPTILPYFYSFAMDFTSDMFMLSTSFCAIFMLLWNQGIFSPSWHSVWKLNHSLNSCAKFSLGCMVGEFQVWKISQTFSWLILWDIYPIQEPHFVVVLDKDNMQEENQELFFWELLCQSM